MKKFFTDYKDLCNHSKQFYKDHWLGTAVVTAISTVVAFAPLAVPVIKEEIKQRKADKKEKEDSSEFLMAMKILADKGGDA